MNFSEFMEQVDNEIDRLCGLNHLCIADFCYRDRYDDGCDPIETAHEALEEEGFPMDLID